MGTAETVEVSIAELLAAIGSRLAIALGVPVAVCREDRKVPDASEFIELESDGFGVADEQDGGGFLTLSVRISARAVVRHNVAGHRERAQQLAMHMAAFVFQNKFGLCVGHGVVLGGGPDDYSPALAGQSAWRTEWSHDVAVNARALQAGKPLPWDDPTELTPVFAWEPNTGIPFEPTYVPIDELELP
jgi:hypothetical protein